MQRAPHRQRLAVLDLTPAARRIDSTTASRAHLTRSHSTLPRTSAPSAMTDPLPTTERDHARPRMDPGLGVDERPPPDSPEPRASNDWCEARYSDGLPRSYHAPRTRTPSGGRPSAMSGA